MLVSTSTLPASRHGHPLTWLTEVGKSRETFFCLFIHDGPDRDFEEQVVGGSPAAVRTLAVGASLGAELGVELVLDERILVRSCPKVNGATTPAVSAVGAAMGDKLLTAKARTPVTTVTGGHQDVDVVDEHALLGALWSTEL